MAVGLSKKNSAVAALIGVLVITALIFWFRRPDSPRLTIKKDAHIIMVGNNLGSRMMNFGYFET